MAVLTCDCYTEARRYHAQELIPPTCSLTAKLPLNFCSVHTYLKEDPSGLQPCLRNDLLLLHHAGASTIETCEPIADFPRRPAHVRVDTLHSDYCKFRGILQDRGNGHARWQVVAKQGVRYLVASTVPLESHMASGVRGPSTTSVYVWIHTI